jgi:hypothetical protein
MMNADVRLWPIATFRCDAELGRYRGNSGHRVNRTKAQFYDYAPSKVAKPPNCHEALFQKRVCFALATYARANLTQ